MHIREEKLPRAQELSGLGQELSREAQVRLDLIDFYRTRGRNAALTCRRFGISRQTQFWRKIGMPVLRHNRFHLPTSALQLPISTRNTKSQSF